MSDLLVSLIDLKVFRDTIAAPTSIAIPAVREAYELQQILTVLTQHNFILPADAVDTPIPSLPSIPYDGMLYIFTSIEIRANINSQGNQIVAPGGFVTMASTSTVLFTNNIIPADPEILTTIAANVRYFAAKVS